MPRIARCLLLLLWPLLGRSQFEPMQNFSVKDGLPSSVVYDCLQDKQGFMWFATAAGLARFDGTNFKVFTTKDGITNNEVLQIIQDEQENIWIVPYGNIPCIINPASGKIYNYRNFPELEKFMPRTVNMYIRHSAAGLVSFRKGQLVKISGKNISTISIDRLIDFWPVNKDTILLFNHREENYRYLSNGQITPTQQQLGLIPSEYYLKNPDWGNLKIFSVVKKTHTQLYIYGFANQKIHRLGAYASINPVNSVQKIGSLLYINTTNGVVITDTLLRTRQYILAGKNVSKSFLDRNGNEWFTTISGEGVVVRMKNNVQRYEMAEGLPDNNISMIRFGPDGQLYCGDEKGNLYILTVSATGIRIKRRNRFFDVVRDMVFEGNAPIVFSNRQIFKQNRTYAVHTSVKSILPYAGNQVIAGCSQGLYVGQNPEKMEYCSSTGLFRALTPFMGKIYYGNNEGLSCINSIKPFSEIQVTGNPLFREPVNHIASGSDGILWIATNTAGLYALYNGKLLAHFDAENGAQRLNSNICKKIFAAPGTHTVWIATNKGINRLNYSMVNGVLRTDIASITSAEGLNDDDVNDICAKNGKIYAATMKGLCIFPENIQPREIPVVLSDIIIKDYKITGTAVKTTNRYMLRHWQNNISISYAGLSFTGNKRPEYGYRLFKSDGDTGWTKTNATTVEFRELPPGEHIFQVMSSTGNMREIRFYINTPFWKTTWFYSLVFISLAVFMTWITYRISKNIKKREARKTAINKRFSELELQALQAQMNPHFVFNAMNTLQNYILKHESENASEYLNRFSRLMRLFLDASRDKFTTLAKETELLQHYIELEQARLDHSFSFSITCDDELEQDTEIPSVLIQPFVENAILHGLRHLKDKNGRLDIHFSAGGNDIICRVSDNGIGREESEKIRKAKGSLYRSQGMQLIEDKIRMLKAIKNIDIEIRIANLFPEKTEMTGTEVAIFLKNINKN